MKLHDCQYCLLIILRLSIPFQELLKLDAQCLCGRIYDPGDVLIASRLPSHTPSSNDLIICEAVDIAVHGGCAD